MRIATYNVEWFDRLFDDDGGLIDDDSWSARWDVTKAQQTAALGAVFQALDADAVMIIEAPDTSRTRSAVRALGAFANRFGLRTSAAILGFANHTQQEIALLYDPNVIQVTHDPLSDDKYPRFDQTFAMDLDVDASPDPIRWSKPPLELALDGPAGPLRLIGVHAKSKAPHGATSDAEAIRISIENRRKQLAQCIWLRGRVDTHLAQGDDLIILGDFNDGPGLDEYEKLFGRSSVEVVLGEGRAAKMYDPHARQALSRRLGAAPTTSRFKRKGQPYLQALLDYIMVSPGLQALNPDWQIWHPFDHPECYENKPLQAALLQASDHFPVVLELPNKGA
ncbi:endonuclease/exonuclease/phosphatase family protein [Yoonia sp. I 8.24]|uniref:endonuclease/exonuclease/phosphatase family protein n=1 Tax=Yoonia sp. I 8.24 TaxID=1537229 RepID=UPI001EDF2B3A|nr:endonuclease/exonuclease/phosphatase family protein [Yoonia sp. I 8.24]MCG3268927.1 endonuclease/exonuclease/phosphatase family protein [Yoonia sp. I 8.24]